MKTRIEIEKLVINSGIFKVNEHGRPEAVLKLNPANYPESIGKETIHNVRRIRYFFNSVCEILLKYHNRPTSSFSIDEEIQETTQELQGKIIKTLAEYFPDSKAEQYAKLITEDRHFRADMKALLKNTGVFEKRKKGERGKGKGERGKGKGERGYYDLILPLYQIFHKYLSAKREIYYYVAHFLIGCNIERGKFTTVYERISKSAERVENKIGIISQQYRKNPESIIHIP